MVSMALNFIQDSQQKMEGDHTDESDFEDRGTVLCPADRVDRMIETMRLNNMKKQVEVRYYCLPLRH